MAGVIRVSGFVTKRGVAVRAHTRSAVGAKFAYRRSPLFGTNRTGRSVRVSSFDRQFHSRRSMTVARGANAFGSARRSSMYVTFHRFKERGSYFGTGGRGYAQTRIETVHSNITPSSRGRVLRVLREVRSQPGTRSGMF